MTTSPRLSTRRHLAFMSATDRDGVVVDENLGLVQGGEAARRSWSQSSSVSLPVTSFLLSTKALAGDQAHGQLLPAHLQGEEDHGFAGELARVEQDVQGQGGLAHAGAGGQQNQVGLVQAGDGRVHIGQAGGQAGDGAVAGWPARSAGSYTSSMTLEMWSRPWADRPWRMA